MWVVGHRWVKAGQSRPGMTCPTTKRGKPTVVQAIETLSIITKVGMDAI